ncbi:TPA: hypothetical protein OOF66_001588 [Morganella morganii]|uniref:hypothetical protein n=1 Tax=Morganella morganii TaxID=582 RepID=UPI0031B47DF8|nr:hypothetical protein [Morganella morganii]HCR4052026.1 hypothetical protein [Morganella morganii]
MTESKQITLKPEGVVTISTDSDGIKTISSDEPLSTNIKTILSYGIENIVDIQSYNIEQKDGKTFHHIVFNSGGTIELSFEPGGKNFSATAHEMLTTITNGERVLIKEKRNQ